MRPMLDDLELPHVQDIATIEQRVLAEHKPLGMEGSLLQNMGRRPTLLSLRGMAASDDAREFLDKLEAKFHDGKPIAFVADIIADANIEKMVIDDLHVQELAGKPQSYSYVLTLREYIEPVEPKETSALDTDIKDDATKLIDDMVPGLNIGLDFSTGLEKFVAPLSDFLARLQKFNSSGG